MILDPKKHDPLGHYKGTLGPVEYQDVEECKIDIKNIGWTLGNDCPYRCSHCYSMTARIKGRDFDTQIVDRIVSQLSQNKIETVNLGGNEPLFTNGLDVKKSLLPYIIEKLHDAGIIVGLTTSGISLIHLEKYYKKAFEYLNDVDISFDSPFESEHNLNRGANIYHQAIKALDICRANDKDCSMIMCAMNWNFSEKHITALVELAKTYQTNVRINPIKPVEKQHNEVALTPEQYYLGFQLLHQFCDPIDLGEPPIATKTQFDGAKGCPCGRTSFRIHSITPDGKIPISPCVYMHEYKIGDLVTEELYDIVRTPQFKVFRIRNHNPDLVTGCTGCELQKWCRGGCAARSYLHNLHETGEKTLFIKDPFCPKEYKHFEFPQSNLLNSGKRLVHMDYLCTWIGKPKI